MARINIDETDGSALSNPSSGQLTIFHDSLDNRLKVKKSDGTIIDFESQSGVRTKVNKTSSFTPLSNETNAIYSYTGTTASVVTLPTSLPEGFFAEAVNLSTGTLTFEAGVGASLLTPNTSNTSLNTQYSRAYFYKQSATEWVLLGDLETSDVPLSLAGCRFWIDFSDVSTLVFSSGNFIEEVQDKSGLGHDLINTTVSEQAERIVGGQNGLDVARFDGTNDGYEVPSVPSGDVTNGADYTMFTVSKQNISANATVMAADRTANNNYHVGITYNSGSNELKFYTQDNTNIEGGLPSRSTLASLALRRNGVDANGWVAGVKQTFNQSTNTSTKNLWIGKSADGSEALNGEICELLIYNRALNDSEVNIILSYLNDKWGSI